MTHLNQTVVLLLIWKLHFVIAQNFGCSSTSLGDYHGGLDRILAI